MFIDIMSKDSYLLVNKKMVKHFGLELSTYFAVLLEIYPRVVEKKLDSLMQTGYFRLQRDYVERECGLKPEQQLALDQALIRLGVLQVNPEDPDLIGINIQQMMEYLVEDEPDALKKLEKKAKTKKTDEAAGKKAGKISTFSGYAATLAHTPEVQEAYRIWITALIEGGKCAFSKTTVQMFHEAMTKFTQDPAVQIEILRQAAASGYPNADWVINSMQNQKRQQVGYTHTVPGTWINTPQKQFNGVSEETF